VYKAASEDLAEARKNQTLGDLSKRLNMELAGYRSLLTKTARALPFASEPASYKEALEGLDERWGDPAYWQAIRRNTSSMTPFYLLAAVDHRIDDLGELAPATPDQAIYLDIFARTFWMGLVITVICLVLAYPLAYLLANLPRAKQPADDSGAAAVLDLDPGAGGGVDRAAAVGRADQQRLMAMGIIDKPLELVFNRTGVYISMVHILLPFMILPIYSVMKGISPTYMRAAISWAAIRSPASGGCTSRRPMPVSAPVACWCSSSPSATTSPRRCWAARTTRWSATSSPSTPTPASTGAWPPHWAAAAAGDRGALSDLQLAGRRQSPAPELRRTKC
jgi:hypothetical protein